MRTLFDTSVLVPALTDQLGNHAAALDALHRYSDGDHAGCCSAHALAECYATLTALPLPTRIMPEEARLLVEDLVNTLAVIELTNDDYQSVLRQVANLGLASGSIYDAVHVQSAWKAGADQILTYNVSHFERLRLPAITVAAP